MKVDSSFALDNQLPHSEDDSPFLSMADFFSLISMTVIYIVIAFSPQSPLASESVNVVTGVAAAFGPASQIDNDVAYVSVLSAAPNVLVRVMPPGNGSLTELVVTADPQGTAHAVAETQALLSSHVAPKRVIFYMGVADESGRAHLLLHELLKATKQKMEVSLVLLDEDREIP